ncbi:hypothetical protein [Bacillus cihuensis]|uniref:hypothetical protein n=1 Tax=Bacillus cihuensis TaxID=1208599 RepID=UPI000401EA3E|nr:hypothetical protein [Bacillus cihuensis]
MSNIRFTVNVDGVERTIANINRFDIEATLKAKAIIRKNALGVGRDSRKVAPRKTGKLSKAISTKFYINGMYAVTGPNHKKAPHRAFFVHGTKDRFRKNGGFTGRVNEIRYMESAEQKYKQRFEQEIKQTFDKDVEV